MKKLMIFLFLIILLTGCTSKTNEEIRWFKSQKEAIAYGLKYEEIKKNDILEVVDLKDENVVVFKFDDPYGKGICIAHLIHKDNQYQWYRDLQRVILKSEKPNVGNLNVTTDFKTINGKEYKLYLGVAENSNFTINTDTELNVKPKIDQDTGMYYIIEKK
ncbi:hypothetical protein SC499_26235 [Peribacillus simplex]|uniref:hypothetical protein n=1 Tax=Peribacillus simplex TaxID=1478 RepID=UPI00298E086D|nr:hypothetical protein [Peribacillus simplex]MDW7618054.1 hypothetical protein [Peribacillus simplex]